LIELVRSLVQLTPPNEVPAALVTQPRYGGRWRQWTPALEETTGSLLVAEQLPPPVVKGTFRSPALSCSGCGQLRAKGRLFAQPLPRDNEVWFGVNLVPDAEGKLRVGETVTVEL
jgi:hypothetical protein